MIFKPIAFQGEEIEYINPTWDDMNVLAFDIAKKAFDKNLMFVRIITLAKGGWPMTRSLVDFLKVEKVASIGVNFYAGINERLEKPRIYQDLPVSVVGENILLFDDVADTGESLLFVKDYLKSLGINSVSTATLFYKSHSRIKPDFYGSETDAWIVFPYDMVEMIDVLGGKWKMDGIEHNELIERFRQLGFGEDVIQYYLEE